ncbi:hypothetical protein RchiOBHm_Chr6g0291391 [Rosa chinensis]|uniref:Uncharacterized protein n=1 Tax=Rosa chinensis TaxID=74649 RepID=A0A2P6PW39_ROSCH|nr:hypothetical protein RchiOBHm_Chr6g0291391 [Rosa chinensis]
MNSPAALAGLVGLPCFAAFFSGFLVFGSFHFGLLSVGLFGVYFLASAHSLKSCLVQGIEAFVQCYKVFDMYKENNNFP